MPAAATRKRAAAAAPLATPCRLVILADLGPVDHVPPRRDVLRPAVLVLEVVGMFPDVEAEDRRAPLHERAVLVGRGLDAQRSAAVQGEPGPAAAEAARGRLGELVLERVEAADGLGDRLSQRAAGLASRVGAQK